MILNNGTYGGVRILSPEVVGLIFHNFNTRFPGDEHGLGFELDQYYTAGPMASLQVCSGPPPTLFPPSCTASSLSQLTL
jgi:hypothetical protein